MRRCKHLSALWNFHGWLSSLPGKIKYDDSFSGIACLLIDEEHLTVMVQNLESAIDHQGLVLLSQRFNLDLLVRPLPVNLSLIVKLT